MALPLSQIKEHFSVIKLLKLVIILFYGQSLLFLSPGKSSPAIHFHVILYDAMGLPLPEETDRKERNKKKMCVRLCVCLLMRTIFIHRRLRPTLLRKKSSMTHFELLHHFVMLIVE